MLVLCWEAHLAVPMIAALYRHDPDILRRMTIAIGVLATLPLIHLFVRWLRAPKAVRFDGERLSVVTRLGRVLEAAPYGSLVAPCSDAKILRISPMLRLSPLLTHHEDIAKVVRRLRAELGEVAPCRRSTERNVHFHSTKELEKVYLTPPSWHTLMLLGTPLLVAVALVAGAWWPLLGVFVLAGLGKLRELNAPRAITVQSGELVIHFESGSHTCRPLYPLRVAVLRFWVEIANLRIARRAFRDGDLERIRDAISEALGRDVTVPLCSCGPPQWLDE